MIGDGFNRDVADWTFTDSGHLIAVQRAFDAAGRIISQTNPSLLTNPGLQGDGLGYSTYYTYDSLNRVTKVTTPDGNSTTTSYAGNAVTVTDANSKATKTIRDALGRMTFVYEDWGNTNLQTQYGYDALGDLTSVFKCSAGGCGSGQQRTFSYDALGRLTQASNVEATAPYTYSYTGSSGSNLLALQKRTDPRGNTTTYTRDAMDKVTGITYNDTTPNATFTYNAVGNLTSSSNSNVTNNYTSFDADGRVTASNVQAQGNTYAFTYTYDLAGDLIQENYPSGRVLKTTYDMAQRPTTTSGTASGTTTNYVQAVQYYPHGATYTLQYGSNMWWCQNFSKNLQPVEAWSAANNNGSSWMMYTSHGFNNNETVSSQNLG